MRRVPTLGVGDRQPTHELGQVAIATRPKHEMPVIGHHAPGQNPHRQTGLGLADHLLERLEVSLLAENPYPPLATRNRRGMARDYHLPPVPSTTKTPDPFTPFLTAGFWV